MKPSELSELTDMSDWMTTDRKIAELWKEYRRQQMVRERIREVLELLATMAFALALMIGFTAIIFISAAAGR